MTRRLRNTLIVLFVVFVWGVINAYTTTSLAAGIWSSLIAASALAALLLILAVREP